MQVDCVANQRGRYHAGTHAAARQKDTVSTHGGYGKVCYRSLAKNTAHVLTLFALSNVWLKRKALMPAVGKVCM